nr:MAG TPA: hypothetical protein [Bacteriophage sp.]
MVSQYRQTPKARKTPLKRLCGQKQKITAPELFRGGLLP